MLYWAIITLIYVIGDTIIYAIHRKIEKNQQRMIDNLLNTIRLMGGEVTEEEGKLTIHYEVRGEDE